VVILELDPKAIAFGFELGKWSEVNSGLALQDHIRIIQDFEFEFKFPVQLAEVRAHPSALWTILLTPLYLSIPWLDPLSTRSQVRSLCSGCREMGWMLMRLFDTTSFQHLEAIVNPGYRFDLKTIALYGKNMEYNPQVRLVF